MPWHILAPRRGCFGNHLPLRRVALETYFHSAAVRSHGTVFFIRISCYIKKTFIPVIRTKVCSSSLYHLLHHTNICVLSNGRIPAQLTFEYHSRSSPCAFLCIPAFRFSLQLRSDLHHLRYLHRASTFSGSLWLSSQDYCLHLSFSSMTILL